MIERIIVAAACLIFVGAVVFLALRMPRFKGEEIQKAINNDVSQGDFIVTCGNVIVRYRPNRKKRRAFVSSGREQGVTKRLQEILAANPEADLSPLQDALGIEVLNVQRPVRRQPADIDGVVLGDEG